ncbi:hypothetical protein E4U43_001761 [Claviceps pusilla]|uniref:Vegetatible incompatibility protein het-e-1 n=1 Tax=Claviceps pusilla TaxID=123648 RepID=A0A9P7N760_9HYPO|nr:hypothetical protein E4U43_001761 [Claviceps pusilla]
MSQDPSHLSLEPAMHSPSDLAEQGRCETARPPQEEEVPRNQGELQVQYDDDSTSNVDLSATGLLVADHRPDLQGTTSFYNIHGSSYPSPRPASTQSAACHSRYPGDPNEDKGEDDEEDDEEDAGADEDEGADEGLSDLKDGADLDQVPFKAQQQPDVHPGSHLSGTLAEGGDDNEAKSDDGSSEVSGADVTNAQQLQSANNDPESSPYHPLHPHLNFSGPPNFPSHLQTLHGAPLMMMMLGTESPDAAWAEGSWTVTENVDPQGPDPVAEANTLDVDDAADALPTIQISNPNPAIPGSENLGVLDFLHHWARHGSYENNSHRYPPPHLYEVVKQARTHMREVNYSDLNGDSCDFQALNWAAMETTRSAARVRRYLTYKNYVNRAGSDVLTPGLHTQKEDAGIPSYENFFRFSRMTFRPDIHLAHFQLRSVLACPSRTFAYYPGRTGINRINTVSRKAECVMNMREFPAMGGALSTLDAGCGVLVGGTFCGHYYMKPLDCEDQTKFIEGRITSDFSGITNHISVYRPRRSSGPVAAISSNDCGFRVLDVTTERFISEAMYPFALNCSALSPDHRLRVVVGDHSSVLITNADTGEVLQQLSGHRDYGFACDWSEDGRTVATGFQDREVKIWDARKWCNSSGIGTPLCTLRSEMASVRGLRFSPLGSGRPVLVAAEEADFLNIIDAKTFSSKQTLDVFGEIGGVSFSDEGQSLSILCCDLHRGGLLQLERCGQRPEPILDEIWLRDVSRIRHLAGRDGLDSFEYESKCKGRRPTQFCQQLQPF